MMKKTAATNIEDRKRADELPAVSERHPSSIADTDHQGALLEALFARVPEAIVLLDTNDRILQVNPQFTRMFGYAQEEACGRLINGLLVPEDLSAEGEAYTRRGLQGESLNIETVRKHKDGTCIHVSIVSGPVSIAGSQISEYVIYRDITERKRAEEALQRSERNLTAIINTIPTTAWTARPDGYCDFLNQVWLDYAGMAAEQAQGWGWAEAIHPDDRKRLVEEWQSSLASGAAVDTEARIRRFDGSYRWFLIRANPLKDESGNILKWYGTCIDIGDRKKAEEALRSSERNLSLLINAIPTFIGVLGTDGSMLYANQTVLDYTGLTLEDVQKEDFRSRIFHPEDVERLREERRDALTRAVPFENEQRVLGKDGSY